MNVRVISLGSHLPTSGGGAVGWCVSQGFGLDRRPADGCGDRKLGSRLPLCRVDNPGPPGSPRGWRCVQWLLHGECAVTVVSTLRETLRQAFLLKICRSHGEGALPCTPGPSLPSECRLCWGSPPEGRLCPACPVISRTHPPHQPGPSPLASWPPGLLASDLGECQCLVNVCVLEQTDAGRGLLC